MHPSRSTTKNHSPRRQQSPATALAPRLEPLEGRRLLAAGPDGFGYRADSTSPLSYDLDRTDFDVITLMDEQTADDVALQIPLGADKFNYYGENFDSIWVSSNGL